MECKLLTSPEWKLFLVTEQSDLPDLKDQNDSLSERECSIREGAT